MFHSLVCVTPLFTLSHVSVLQVDEKSEAPPRGREAPVRLGPRDSEAPPRGCEARVRLVQPVSDARGVPQGGGPSVFWLAHIRVRVRVSGSRGRHARQYFGRHGINVRTGCQYKSSLDTGPCARIRQLFAGFWVAAHARAQLGLERFTT